MIGPNTALGYTSMTVVIEAQVGYVLDCLRYMREHDVATVDVDPRTQAAFVEEMDERLRGTVFTAACQSWYRDPSGRPSIAWPDYSFRFRRRMRRFEPDGYRLRLPPVDSESSETTRDPVEAQPV